MTTGDFQADVQAVVADFRGRAIEPVKRDYARYERLLRKANIDTYEKAFQVLGDDQADLKLRRAAGQILYSILLGMPDKTWQAFIDRRQVVGSVMRAIQTKDRRLKNTAVELAGQLRLKRTVLSIIEIALHHPHAGTRSSAVRALNYIDDPRAIDPLLEIVSNKNEDPFVRISILSGSWRYENERAVEIWQRIMLDPTESSQIRAEAAEWLSHMGVAATLPAYIQLLGEAEVELRFWAAFGLVTLMSSVDISDAMPLIDRTVAHDMAVNGDNWGWWSVASEAIPALEAYWYARLVTGKTDGVEGWYNSAMLISPRLEYWDFQQASRHLDVEKGVYEFTLLEQQTTLSIDPAWFTEKILGRWPAAKMNVRQPQPEALILDWLIPTEAPFAEDEPPTDLMGGLHRNGYWIFLTGEGVDITAFARWLRGLIEADIPLRLYYWADPGMVIDETFSGL